MDEERKRENEPDTAEGAEGEELSKKVPDEASGEGETPLGDTDQHSGAPGPTGTEGEGN